MTEYQYSEVGRDVMERARQYACERGHNYIKPGFLLWGLMNCPMVGLALGLDDAGFSPQDLEAELLKVPAESDWLSSPTYPDLCDESQQIMDEAATLATETHRGQIGPEHILHGICAVPDTVASAFLKGWKPGD